MSLVAEENLEDLESKLYDIFHVEDESDLRLLFKVIAQDTPSYDGKSIKYKNTNNLQELYKFLESENRAKVYVIDGCFPEDNNTNNTGFIAHKAVKAIREKDPYAKIFLYSHISDVEKKGEELGVIGIDKTKTPQDLLNEYILPYLRKYDKSKT